MKIFYTFLKNHQACLKTFLNFKMDQDQAVKLFFLHFGTNADLVYLANFLNLSVKFFSVLN